MTNKTDDQGFLRRWSARKLENHPDRDEEEAVAPSVDDEAKSKDASQDTKEPAAAPVAELSPEDLPDVESLNADSDFTMFLGDNVPQDLAKMALRKLWRSDPVLANLDGLNDYDEDFSAVGMTSEVVKTAYQIGKGFLTDDEETPPLADDDVNGVASPDEDGDVVADPESALKSDAEPVLRENDEASTSENIQRLQDDEEIGSEEFHNAEFTNPG